MTRRAADIFLTPDPQFNWYIRVLQFLRRKEKRDIKRVSFRLKKALLEQVPYLFNEPGVPDCKVSLPMAQEPEEA